MKKKEFKLTHSQQKALNNFKAFINDAKAKVFILKGYAGTGKTTLTREFIKEMEQRGLTFSLLASTGRAAKILANATNCTARTVHGEIYKFTDLNQDLEKIAKQREQKTTTTEPLVDDTGQLLLNFELTEVEILESEKGKTRYYFVDEASMVADVSDPNATQAQFGSGRLLHDLLEYDKEGRFIFIGDVCQLPPITQPISPALSSDYFSTKYGIQAYMSELTEIVRQEGGNDIVVASTKLRELYHHPQPWRWAKFPFNGYRNIHVLASQTELISHYIAMVKEKGFNAATLICQTNRQADMLTGILRPSFGHQSPYLEKGDLLLVTQNNLITGLMNGDLVTVQDVGRIERRAGIKFQAVTVKEMFSQAEYTQLLITNVLYGNGTNISQIQQRELLLDFYYRMKDKGIKQKTPQFNMAMMNDPYLNALRAVYGYALTCHKAQGGEWDYVFLDIPRSLPLQEKPGVYQWVYTAVTRARKELYTPYDFWVI